MSFFLRAILFVVVFCALLSLKPFSLAHVAGQDPNPRLSQDASATQNENPSGLQENTVTHYTLPPDLLTKAHGLYISQIWLRLASGVYGLIVLLVMLRWRWVGQFRTWAEGASRNSFVQAAIIIPLLVVSFSVLTLPPDMVGQHISRKYGISVQSWPSWFQDWAVGLLLTVVVGTILGWILYAVIRRSPRRWWLWFWVAVVPISAFLTFIAPLVIDPLFNKFVPLQSTHAELVSELEKVAHRGGLDIPPSRMFEMKASEKLTGSNAYVTGFGASKRVVVWDTAIKKMTPHELLFVFGHEMGHYVLGHILYGFLATMALFFVMFYLMYRIGRWAMNRWGAGLGIRGLDDWASLPVLLLIISVLAFLSEPIGNAYSRHLEHQADQYGLEVVHGVFPDSGQVAARSFQKLGEEWLEYPYASKAAVFWAWSHPPIGDRIEFSLNYDPWGNGREPQFVKSQ